VLKITVHKKCNHTKLDFQTKLNKYTESAIYIHTERSILEAI